VTQFRDSQHQSSAEIEQIGKRAALLGHDIRNAVGDILGGLSLADLTPLDTGSARQMQRVRSAGEQLARLTDEVLSLISGEAVPGTAELRNLKLDQFLDEIDARWGAHAQEKGLRFSLQRGGDLPAMIGTDRVALERILSNLLGNAMKHTSAGEVTLSVEMSSHEALRLTVRDTGPGFSDQALARLFEAGGRPTDSATPGSGLGLHIVHELADRIGGHMHVANRQLGGAEVTLSLPRAAWAPGTSGIDSHGMPDLTGFSVLVAEDNQTNQLLVRQMLETLGAEARLAADGVAALELLEQYSFDLALLDIEMPRLSGLDLIRTLREREAQGHGTALPVLAITAFVLNANRAGIYDAGADGILAKPIMSLESFGEAISAVLKKHGPAVTTPDRASGEQPPLDILHLDRLLALAGSENGQELLTRLSQDFRTVQDGILTGLTGPDFPLLRARTHVLISLAGAVGAERLQSLAESLNTAAHNRDADRTGALGPMAGEEIAAVLAQLNSEYANRFKAGAA